MKNTSPARRRPVLSISVSEKYRQPLREALTILRKGNPFASTSATIVESVLNLDADNAVIRPIDLRTWTVPQDTATEGVIDDRLEVIAISIPKGKLDDFYDALDRLRQRSPQKSQSALIVHSILVEARETMREEVLRTPDNDANDEVEGLYLTQDVLDRFWEAWRHDNRKEIRRIRSLVKRSVLSPTGQSEEQRALQTDALQRIAIASRDDDNWRDAWSYIGEAVEIASLLPDGKANYKTSAYYRQASIAAEGATFARGIYSYHPLKALAITSISRAYEISGKYQLPIHSEVAGRYGYLSAWANRSINSVKALFAEAYKKLPKRIHSDTTGITVSEEGLLHNQARAVLCLHEHGCADTNGPFSLEGGLAAVDAALKELDPRWRLDATVTRLALLLALGCREQVTNELALVLRQYDTESARINRRLEALKKVLNTTSHTRLETGHE